MMPTEAVTPRGRMALAGAGGDVEVWRARLDDHGGETIRWLESLLSPDERARARGFFLDRDRRRFAVCRGIVREILARRVGGAAAELRFSYGPGGKPALPDSGVHFSIAHSGPLALLAITTAGEVGVDVEQVRPMPDFESVARSALPAEELERLMACPPERRQEEFFHAWTRQEAILKALGTGLGGVTPDEQRAAFAVYPLKVDSGYAAALAVARTARQPGDVVGWSPARVGLEQGTETKEINLT